jgi:archaellum component FlaG (FlaF/FlaG flagellin family)
MAMQKIAVGAVFLFAVLLLTATALAILQSTKTISNTGNIKAVNVSLYQDSSCTIPLSALTWSNVEPNSSTIQTVYVKNEGTAPMTLNMTTNTWNPANALTYITVTWNQENTIVNPGNNVQANVTLTVSPSIAGITSFTFTIVIKGTG